MTPSVLFIGGTGTISASCVREALVLGWEVTVLNRGRSLLRPVPQGVHVLSGDVSTPGVVASAVNTRSFDVVADFLAYTPDDVAGRVEAVRGKTSQYVFISSASAYQKPVASLPITESTPLVNPYWTYSQKKIACEQLLVDLVRAEGFPATVVRPSHTYDATMLPNAGGWTDIARLRAGKPVVIPGDGTSLWTLTHATDFAYCFVRLLGDRRAIGNIFHITGDEVLPWNAIYAELATAAGVAAPSFVHVASTTIARELPDLGPGLLGDKSHSVVFDNTKVRAIATGFHQKVPWWRGAREIIACHDTHRELQSFDPAVDAAWDRLATLV